MNTMKTVLFLTLLTGLFLVIGHFLGGKTGMIIAFILAVVMNFASYWFSSTIVLKMYSAQEVTAADDPELHGMVRRLAQRAQLPMPKVYVINDPQPNAFATGRNPENGVVAVTTGIRQLLTPEELSGVIGHELAHIQNRDILIGTVAATFAGAIGMVAEMAQWALMLAGFSGQDDEEETSPLMMLPMLIVAPIAAFLIQMAVSRSREYVADADGARIAGNPRYLSNALRKLEQAAQHIPGQMRPATAHMCIVNPLTGGALMRLFSTHPPMEERVKRLEQPR